MNNRKRIMAVLNYEKYDRLPVVHFGFWAEPLRKWALEGHLSTEEAASWGDGTPTDAVIGGMNKNVFSLDYASVDAEIERLKPLLELGGYIPCPDHRIAPNAKWDNVKYYCGKMHNLIK